jgi:hypothetical protein
MDTFPRHDWLLYHESVAKKKKTTTPGKLVDVDLYSWFVNGGRTRP